MTDQKAAEAPQQTFMQWHEQQMAEMAAALVFAAGGEIVVTPKHMRNLHQGRLIRTDDHATGNIIYTMEAVA